MSSGEEILEAALRQAMKNISVRPDADREQEDLPMQHHEHAVVRTSFAETPNLIPGAVRSS